MLSASEFGVGAFKDASPLSIILPRGVREETVLIGSVGNARAAVFLSGRFTHAYFLTAESDNWHGLIVPDVRIEVDENSVFDSGLGSQLGAIIRADTTLSIRAKAERSAASSSVTLQTGLPSIGDYRAGFSRWQVVLGKGLSKRVLWPRPLPEAS